MNVYLWANEIDPQTLGSLNLEGIYRWGDEVWTSGDKYELITSNGNYWTIWHNLTEWTFVISRHPASHWNPNNWALSAYYPIVIIADHDYWVDPADDIELWTYTDWDWNTVKQILAWTKNAITTYTPWSLSVSWYHVPQIEEYRELIRLVAPILASGNSQDVDGMYLFKVLRFSLNSQDRENAIANYQYNWQWWTEGTWMNWTDTYWEICDDDVCMTGCPLSSSVFSTYDDSKFSSLFFGIASPSYTQSNGVMRLFRNIEQTKFAPYISRWYCSHTIVDSMISNDIIYSWVNTDGLWTYVSPLWTNNFYFPAGIEYYSTWINICAKFTWYSNFPYYWATSIMAEEMLIEGDNMRLHPTDYWTSTYNRYSDIWFQLNYPDSLYLYIWWQQINLSYPNQRPSAYGDYTKYKNPYIYVWLTPNNVYITVANGPIPSASTSIWLDVTIDVSNNSDYQNLYPKLLAKKFVHIKWIEDTNSSWVSVATAVNFGMPLSLFKQEAFVGWYTPWYDWTWRTFYEDYAEIL
jgi:hypothetical protein